MEKPISLDGVRMRVVSTAEGGEVNIETLFGFTQDGSVVSAHYAGGKVRLGYLVGTMCDEGLRAGALIYSRILRFFRGN